MLVHDLKLVHGGSIVLAIPSGTVSLSGVLRWFDIFRQLSNLLFTTLDTLEQLIQPFDSQKLVVFPVKAWDDDLGDEAPRTCLVRVLKILREQFGHFPDSRANEKKSRLSRGSVRAYHLLFNCGRVSW